MKKAGVILLLGIALSAPALAAGYEDLNAGLQLFSRAESAGALPWFDKAIASGELSDGLSYVAHFDRGVILMGQGEPEKAIEDLSASLALRPGDDTALFTRADAYLAARKFDLADADLSQLIANRPGLPEGYLVRSALYAMQGRAADGLRDLQTAQKAMEDLDLSGAGSHFNLGTANWNLERYAEAEENFSGSLPGRGIYGWLWLSLTRAAQGKEISSRSLPAGDVWPAPIANFFLGKQDAETVFAAAAAVPDPATQQGQVCEANFYVGLLLRQRGDGGAAAMIRKAAQTCPKGFVEWMPAQVQAAKTP